MHVVGPVRGVHGLHNILHAIATVVCRSGNEAFVQPADKTSKNWNRPERWTDEIEVITVMQDFACAVESETCCAGVNEFDSFDLQAHAPLHKGNIVVDGHRFSFEKNIIAALHQSILSPDVRLDTLFLLCWVDEDNIFGVNSFPLFSSWTRLAVRLGEQMS